MGEHTKLPWCVEGDEETGYFLYETADADDSESLAEFNGPNAEADANLARLACNSHDELVEAMIQAKMMAHQARHWRSASSRKGALENIYKILRAALADVEKE